MSKLPLGAISKKEYLKKAGKVIKEEIEARRDQYIDRNCKSVFDNNKITVLYSINIRALLNSVLRNTFFDPMPNKYIFLFLLNTTVQYLFEKEYCDRVHNITFDHTDETSFDKKSWNKNWEIYLFQRKLRKLKRVVR